MVPTFKSYCSHLIRGRVVCFFVFLGGSYLGDRSGNGIHVGFDKIFVFCNKFCIRSGKCVFIVVKTKCVNSGNINGICGKLNFTTKYTCFTINDINFIKKHRHRTIFDASGKTVS